MGRDIFGDNAPCPDNRAVPNSDAADYDGMGSNPHIIAYNRVFRFSTGRRNPVFAANYHAIEQRDVRTDVNVLVHHDSPSMYEK
jgi:hypothetical protein